MTASFDDDAPPDPVRTIDALSEVQVESYCSLLRETLRQVFARDDAEGLVADFRGRLRGAGATAELHALHFDALQVAADLTGRPMERPVTSAQKAAYSRLLSEREGGSDMPEDGDFRRRLPEDLMEAG